MGSDQRLRRRTGTVAVTTQGRPGVVDSFTGPYAFLSNFHPSPVVLGGHTYPTGEHAFNAAKTTNPAERATVQGAVTPADAKRAGRHVTLRDGWDDTVRYRAMRAVVDAKFDATDLTGPLLATGDDLLVEGNDWHDQHWGQCRCDRHAPWCGGNHLGRELMSARARIRGDGPDRWVRAAVTGHRPQHLPGAAVPWVKDELGRVAAKLAGEHDTRAAISGMAVGADQWWARAALTAGLDLWAYIPSETQDARWRPGDRRVWRELRAAASYEFVLAPGYDVRFLHERNRFMVRDCDVLIAVWDGAKMTGGTGSTVHAARAAGKVVVHVSPDGSPTRVLRPQP